MRRATPERLRDIIDHIEEAERIRPATRTELESDRRSRTRLDRLVEIIGEAANHVHPAVREAPPRCPGAKSSVCGNHIAHGYFDVDLGALWNILTNDLRVLLPRIRAILDGLSDDHP
ncbi:HepT-like ribonuclease domain-containing protein [Gandjariella thermophila]|uniref:DUF86 domain-containing protein n=1 Tax=Gandjariella thermophila TaxID=1931992 RepID=A0A4D4J4B0_9PSEU|nr:HepT-like ribonuclease domain-containing protein [Gandjariella thermophila]GDY31361.1 DUF86 domain-containing protein [Gandjariella thermophila]